MYGARHDWTVIRQTTSWWKDFGFFPQIPPDQNKVCNYLLVGQVISKPICLGTLRNTPLVQVEVDELRIGCGGCSHTRV